MIQYPTSITQTTAILLDNIFVNNVYHDIDSAIIYNDMSDHLPTAVRIETKCVLHKHLTLLSFKRTYTADLYVKHTYSADLYVKRTYTADLYV